MFKKFVREHTIVITDSTNDDVAKDIIGMIKFGASTIPHRVEWVNIDAPSRYTAIVFVCNQGEWVYTKCMVDNKYPGLCIFDPKMGYED